jgi:hypothetical protein
MSSTKDEKQHHAGLAGRGGKSGGAFSQMAHSFMPFQIPTYAIPSLDGRNKVTHRVDCFSVAELECRRIILGSFPIIPPYMAHFLLDVNASKM